MAGRGGENIAHCASVRMSVFGLGRVHTKLLSLNGTRSETLGLTYLQPTGDIFPTNVANFKAQRMCLMVFSNTIDFYWTIGKIIPFVKPSATGYPQWT